MIDLRLNYPPFENESSVLQYYLQMMSSNDLQQRFLLPPWRGIQEDHAVVAQWLSTQGGQIAEEAISICTSSHHALVVLTLAAQLRGATVVTEDFTYSGFKAIAELFDIHLVSCESDEFGLLPTALESVCKQRSIRALYVQPTIHNPLGTIMPLERRQAIAEIATTYKLLIIEDDAYRFLAPNAPPRFCDLVPQQTVFIISLTKPFNPLLKIAYIIAPSHLAPSLTTAIRLTSSGASALLSFVASQLIRDGKLDQIIKDKQAEASARQALVRNMLAGFHLQAHPTSYHVWIHLPQGYLSTTIHQRLLGRGVDVVPGGEFAVDSRKGSEHIRIALGSEKDRGRLEQGISLLREELQTVQ
jgi:DNA-binding transcriptional MocR family regulator